MLKKIFLSLIAVIIIQVCVAQQKASGVNKNSIIFHSFNMFNLLYNSQGMNAGLQSVNGFAYSGSFVGVGAAMDWYGIRSVPVFLDLRHEFKLGNARVFAYGDLGYNISWPDGNSGRLGYSSVYKSDGGIYYDLGLGYLIPFNKKNAMVLSGGYTVKEMKEQYGFSPCSWTGQCGTMTYEKYAYRYQRLSVKIGWRF